MAGRFGFRPPPAAGGEGLKERPQRGREDGAPVPGALGRLPGGLKGGAVGSHLRMDQEPP